MRHSLLSRAAARVRRSLGVDGLAQRLDTLEAYAGSNRSVYLGDHTALAYTRWGSMLFVDTRDSVLAPCLLLHGVWETTVTGWLQSVLRPGQVFVDVGANIGYFSLLGSKLVGGDGRVVSVEAHPRLAELLRRNVILNDLRNVVTWQRAAWSEESTLKFHLRANFASNSSVGSLGSSGLSDHYDSEEIVEVQGTTLDELLRDVPRVDVIKVDVEGAEVRSFAGLQRTLESNPQITIMFEWSPGQIRMVGDEPEVLLETLAGLGFGFQLLDDELTSIARSELLDLHYGNVVATRSTARTL
ncbi:MAG TPA: FkbM family methyltransferase [Acidimicrobiales bacterium]|nr:FkbM family methyltransferase [Acidimicrobiales bacterium]